MSSTISSQLKKKKKRTFRENLRSTSSLKTPISRLWLLVANLTAFTYSNFLSRSTIVNLI